MGRLVELAESILSNAHRIENELEAGGLEIPSSEMSPSLDNLSSSLRIAQGQLLEKVDELSSLVQGPRKFLELFTHDQFRTLSVQYIVRFGLAKKVPLEGASTFPELAASTGQSEHAISRFLRHAMTYRVFRETRDGKVAHTPLSKAIATDEVLEGFLRIALDVMWPAAARAIDALERWPDAQEPKHSGHSVAYNTDKPFFVTVHENPNLTRHFDNAMQFFLASPSYSPNLLADNLNLSTASKLVDIGGSSGSVAFALARKNPGIECIVQDQVSVVEPFFDKVPADLVGRVSYMPHDFFLEQPVRDADVYLLRIVLHDWSDLYAARIIRNVVPAMKPGARLVINDAVLADPHEIAPYHQQFARTVDLEMMATQNGRERDRQAWVDLLKQADPRLVLREIFTPPEAILSILTITL